MIPAVLRDTSPCAGLGLAIVGMLRGDSIPFNIGLVTAVDTDVVPWSATVAGQDMPFLGDHITVGSFVYYAYLPDAVAFGSQFELADPTSLQIEQQPGFPFASAFNSPGLVNPLTNGLLSHKKWLGGIVFYGFSSPSLSLSSVDTNVTGANLDTHPPNFLGTGWDGSPVNTPLPSPVDEYSNLGGGLWLRSHGNIGLNNMPGARPSPSPGEYAASSDMVIVRNAKSILARSVATTLTTLTSGVSADFPEITATGPGQLALFVVHPRFVSYGGLSSTTTFNLPDGAPPDSKLSGPSLNSIGSRGTLAFGGITTWEAGGLTPSVTLTSGSSRQVALSSFLCEPADIV